VDEAYKAELHGIKMLQANRASLWVVILKLVPVQYGDRWGFIWGDLPTGVAAFDNSPSKAMMRFEEAMDTVLEARKQ